MRRHGECNKIFELKAMIYVVSWYENATPQSVFFNSRGHAKYFVQRLQRNADCLKIVLEESEVLVA